MATTKANLNIKIDKGVKNIAAQILSSMGLDHTTAIEIYYRQIIKERRLPFQPESSLTLDEQLAAAIEARNIPHVKLDTDANGNIIIDERVKEQYPDIYDWAVNG